MKKLFSLLLALALTLTLALPAFAAVDLDELYIITQPVERSVIPFGAPFTLEVKVNVPQGAEVSYQWGQVTNGQSYHYKMDDATEPVFQCAVGDYAYPNAPSARPYLDQTKEYACTIVAIERDGDGNAVNEKTLVTQVASVTVLGEREATKWELFRDRWIDGPFFTTIAFCAASYGLLIPVSPLIWLYFLIAGPLK